MNTMRSHRVHSKKAEDLSKASHTPPRARVSAAAAPFLRNFAHKKHRHQSSDERCWAVEIMFGLRDNVSQFDMNRGFSPR